MSIEGLNTMSKNQAKIYVEGRLGVNVACEECKDGVCFQIEGGQYKVKFDKFGKATLLTCEEGEGEPNKGVFDVIMRQSANIRSVVSACIVLLTVAAISLVVSNNAVLSTVTAYIEHKAEREKNMARQMNEMYEDYFIKD